MERYVISGELSLLGLFAVEEMMRWLHFYETLKMCPPNYTFNFSVQFETAVAYEGCCTKQNKKLN